MDKVEEKQKESTVKVTLQQLCLWWKISRQAYYQQKKRDKEEQAKEAELLEAVRQIRQRHPRLGTRKIHQMLSKANKMPFGRDKFFDFLGRQGLLVKPKKRGHRTTESGWWRCENLLKEFNATAPHQVWVSDITYLETEQGFAYLFLITDAFSRTIVGYHLAPDLRAEGAVVALNMALRQRPTRAPLIHHSDHGLQYTSKLYRSLLRRHHIRSSMGEVGNCYDNALAERMNGILKIEYLLDSRFVSFRQAQMAVRQAVWLYNHERPHLALRYQVPMAVHLGLASASLT